MRESNALSYQVSWLVFLEKYFGKLIGVGRVETFLGTLQFVGQREVYLNRLDHCLFGSCLEISALQKTMHLIHCKRKFYKSKILIFLRLFKAEVDFTSPFLPFFYKFYFNCGL